ncbi:MAG: hypothetical protein M3024_10955 [Candidatus Dormibacteraeota bacterium]|nr:hypothetical protein [Candidatus Dormibacteraeota bacterium]
MSLLYEPVRIADTRVTNYLGPPSPLTDGQELPLPIGGHTFGNETIPTNVTGIIANLTVVNATGDGYLVAWTPDAPPNPPPPEPDTSSINFAAGGAPLANMLIARLGPGGQLFSENGLFLAAHIAGGGNVDVIVDLIGYTA